MDFFSLAPTMNYELSTNEKMYPIFILIFLIIVLIIFKNKLTNNKRLDMSIRYGLAIISLLFLALYYILKWYDSGLNYDTIPLHICFISNILCIILIPLYFYVIYDYRVKFIDCIKNFIILQLIGIPIYWNI